MKRPLIVTAAAVLVISAVAGSTLAEGARAPTPAALARQLAAGVAAARTDAARYQAVLGVMKALHVPVFTSAGKQLVRGGKGLPRSFNLYDFELHAAANSFTQTTDVEGFARMLSSGGRRVTAGAVEHALEQGIRAAVARPSSQASTVGLLVRELGLRHRPASDLREVSADRTTLDPLQTLLIIADTAVRAAPAGSRRLSASAGPTTAPPCEGSTDPSGSLLGPGTPLLGPVYLVEATIAIWMKWASTELSVIKGLPAATHLGPRGHAPLAGRKMRFGVHAEMTVDVPDSLKCGYLRVQGGQFPPKGPRSTRVLSFTSGELEKYGTVSADRITNARGDAFLTFTPKTERVPGFGSEKLATGKVIWRTPGGAYAPVSVVNTGWIVGYHSPRGFKFSGLKWRLKLCCDGVDRYFATYEITHARKCGDDPFGGKWAVMMHEVADWPGGGGPGVHRDGPASGHWTPGRPIEMEGGAFGPAPEVMLTQSGAQLAASVSGTEPGITILNGGPVTVEEDRDNGAFTWSCPEGP